ncbi:GNAT family N-acetyltransferase [Marinomonas foliarum]|uniref:Acetyltransferase (GNAT) family protein n=1 Tax=Marinomonas foliarum TaxID=491950 RepID=A0A368ZTQ2_9GAMM|nr:GNAT family N-acetyltransferase [Marinomonas foliarum]RCX00372.1 acetyltransferase (GNAT) family protein [Marinomonas foliarum]
MYYLEQATEKHLDEIVDIYMNDLNVAILTYFGRGFIYKMCLDLIERKCATVACLDSGKVIGFIFSVSDNTHLYKYLNFDSLFSLFKKVIFSYSALKTFILSFFLIFLGRDKVKSNIGRALELAHFAVLGEYKGKGIGTDLLNDFEYKAMIEGFNCVFTSSHNKSLVDFYVRTRSAKFLYQTNVGGYTSYGVIWELKNKLY